MAGEKAGARRVSSAYDVVIGLEVHAQLLTRTKMFCGCSTVFGAPPNTQTCPVCQGMPGTLPVINRRAVEFGIKTSLAINCAVNADNRFARKHYYYPDMPKNYQISQYEEPLAVHGHLDIEVDGAARRIGIERLHLEEDVGKLIHEGNLETAQSSQVDFNRAGVPLMEIVSKPDIRTSEEAGAYLRGLRAIVVYLGVCDGNMEEGSMRCDANISLKRAGETTLGTKVEVKNLNSFRNVQHALEYEIKRQGRALDAGERIVQETRLWDPDKGQTVSMRSKEFAHDYRYFPEPDLPPLNVEARWIEAVRATLPELPAREAAAIHEGLRTDCPRCGCGDAESGSGRLLRGGREGVLKPEGDRQLGCQRGLAGRAPATMRRPFCARSSRLTSRGSSRSSRTAPSAARSPRTSSRRCTARARTRGPSSAARA